MSDVSMHRPSFAELFTPKLATVLREGYDLEALRADAVAGLTVAVVALPLSMAIAIACGLTPERGLYTSIIAGFLISALGGSRFQIGGPAGAFIGLIASIVERHGYEGLVLATLMAGAIMIAVGLMRWGTYIKFIPYPVTVGFTAGIAVIIFASQLKELLGVDLASEPSALGPKLEAIWGAIGTLRPATFGLAILCVALIIALRRWRPAWPGLLIAVVAGSIVATLAHLDVATIGSRFGGVPRTLPAPTLPGFDLAMMRALLPDAVSIALLGTIESLLSAVVADGMTGRRHRSNCELVAQGIANIASVVFGGMPATGAIARTATNVRTGSRGPISGMLHAAYVLAFMLIAAPLAAYIPLASLGAVLAVVAWNMAEKAEFWALARSSRGDAVVLLATFGLTVFVDLTIGISVGVVLGSLVFLHRMAEAVEISGGDAGADRADEARGAYDSTQAMDRDIMVYRISGAFFFGATAAVNTALDRIGPYPRAFIFDVSEAPLIDSSGARALEVFARKLHRAKTIVLIAGARPQARRALLASGLREPFVLYANSVEEARERCKTD